MRVAGGWLMTKRMGGVMQVGTVRWCMSSSTAAACPPILPTCPISVTLFFTPHITRARASPLLLGGYRWLRPVLVRMVWCGRYPCREHVLVGSQPAPVAYQSRSCRGRQPFLRACAAYSLIFRLNGLRTDAVSCVAGGGGWCGGTAHIAVSAGVQQSRHQSLPFW